MLNAVTGGTGFLGLHLVRELLRRDERLLLLVRRNSAPALARTETFLRACGDEESVIRTARSLVETVEVDLERQPFMGLERDGFHRLADRIDALWHCAGNVSFTAALEESRKVNVGGTGQVLRLLSAGEREPVLFHTSSVAVAGARTSGVVREEVVDASCGFNTAYEQSKHEAEEMVCRWVSERDGRAVIYRPSGLITDRPSYPRRPPHPFEVVARAATALYGRGPGRPAGHSGIRLPVARGACTNLVPADYAAYAMTEAPRRRPPSRLQIYHLVNSSDLPLAEVAAPLSEYLGVPVHLDVRPDVRLDANPDAHPGAHPDGDPRIQAASAQIMAYVHWLRTDRRYDNENVKALGLAYPGRPVIDGSYLAASLR